MRCAQLLALAVALAAAGCAMPAMPTRDADAPPATCITVDLVGGPVVHVGANTTFVVSATNCGAAPVHVGDGGLCDGSNGLNVTIMAEGRAWRFGSGGAAVDEAAPCTGTGGGAPRELLPNVTQNATSQWDGTVGPPFHALAPGNYTTFAHVAPAVGDEHDAMGMIILRS